MGETLEGGRILIYATSDLHLSHNKPFVYAVRGYSSIEEMNQSLIDKYNATVSDDDEVYILGDLCLGGGDSLINNFKMLNQLNGKIHIILGNHDTSTRRKMYEALPQVVSISYAEMIQYHKYHFYLSHYPTLTSNLDDDKPLRARTINLCGHSHATDPLADWEKGCIVHCEVDAWNGFPVSLDTIIEKMKQRVQEDDERYAKQLAAIKKCFEGVTGTLTTSINVGESPLVISMKDTPVPKEVYINTNIPIQTQPIANCDKCTFIPGYDCPGVKKPFYDRCPEGYSYQRDALDGGYLN